MRINPRFAALAAATCRCHDPPRAAATSRGRQVAINHEYQDVTHIIQNTAFISFGGKDKR
jgi:hypothetical protein